jgi:CBS domain-containing protein
MAKSVRDVMTPNVHAASPTDSLASAAEIMSSQDVGSLPVVEDGRLIGVLTDRDIVVRAVAEHVTPETLNVGDVASRQPVTVQPDEDLDEALRLMAHHRVRRLPVVEDGRLVGMLSQADVAGEAKEKKVGEMLEEISQPD